MNDKQTAAILIGVAVVAFILWYRKRSEDERGLLFGIGEPGSTVTKGEAALRHEEANVPARPLIDNIKGFARLHGLSPLERRYGEGPPAFSFPKRDARIEQMRRQMGFYGK